jgi:ABC-type nitrate/sulfonate/bicarbonate transport system permease component
VSAGGDKIAPRKPPAPPPWWRTLRADPPFVIRLALGVGMVVALFFVWWLLTRGDTPEQRYISPSQVPSPGDVFISYDKYVGADTVTKDTFDSLRERGLTDSIVATLRRVIVGIAWAAVFGIGLGVLAASYRAVAAALAPVVVFLRSIPMGAMVPLTMVLFKTGEHQKEMFIFLAVVPFVFSDVVAAVSSVPQRYVETAETLGATRLQIVRKVLVPMALPDIVTSLRFQLGLALGYVTLAEAVNAKLGLGFLINTSQGEGRIEEMYLLLFVIALLAFAIDFGLKFFQRGLFPYRKDL